MADSSVTAHVLPVEQSAQPLPGAERARAFGLSWLTYASYYLGRKGFSVTKSAMSQQLGLSTPLMAAIDTAYLAAYAVGQLPSGLLADRIGARRLLGLGMLLSAAACAGFGSVSASGLLLVCFAINGLAQATGWPGTTKCMADWTTRSERGRVMGLWSTCYQVGGIAATALATWLLAHYGFRAAFHVPALWLAVMAAVVLVGLPRSPITTSLTSIAPVDATLPAAAAAVGGRENSALRQLLRNPIIYCYGGCYFCLKLIRYSLLFWLPFYLHAAAGFDESQSGYLSTSFEIGGVVGSIAMGYISDRVGRTRGHSCAVSMLLLAAALFMYARLGVASMVWHFGVMAMIGALLFGPDAVLSGVAAQDAGGPDGAGTAAGLVNGMGSVGALCQGALTVGVQQAFGWNALFYVLFGLSLVGGACLLPTLRVPKET